MDGPSGVLFDLDDTIVDFSGNIEACWLAALGDAARHLGGVVPFVAYAAIERARGWYWGDPDRARGGRRDLRAASAEVVRVGLAEIGLTSAGDLARGIAEDYRDRRDAGLVLLDGALETLERLRGLDVALGLVTNGTGADQRAKIERFGLEPYFAHIQIEGEFGEGKPHPSVYTHALEALGTPPEDTWFVGDHLEWDVAGPQRHAMRGIWVDGGGMGVPSDVGVTPDLVIRGLPELL